MTTIERLEKQLVEHRDWVEYTRDRLIAKGPSAVNCRVSTLTAAEDRQLIMQALIELMEKADRHHAFDAQIVANQLAIMEALIELLERPE